MISIQGEHTITLSPPPRTTYTMKKRRNRHKAFIPCLPKRFGNIMIHASDTDVLVITMAAPSSMSNSESLVAFIHGDTLCYIHIIRACVGDAA